MRKAPDAFRTISEASEALQTPAHVLRFWESKFPQVKPVKRAGGRRYYRPVDIDLLSGIKFLLHEQGMTIRGAQKLIAERGVRHVAGLAPVALDRPVIEGSVTTEDDAALEKGDVLPFPASDAESADTAEAIEDAELVSEAEDAQDTGSAEPVAPEDRAKNATQAEAPEDAQPEKAQVETTDPTRPEEPEAPPSEAVRTEEAPAEPVEETEAEEREEEVTEAQQPDAPIFGMPEEAQPSEPEPEPEIATTPSVAPQAPVPAIPVPSRNAFANLDAPAPRQRVRASALAHALRVSPPPQEKVVKAASALARLEALLRKMGSDL